MITYGTIEISESNNVIPLIAFERHNGLSVMFHDEFGKGLPLPTSRLDNYTLFTVKVNRFTPYR